MNKYHRKPNSVWANVTYNLTLVTEYEQMWQPNSIWTKVTDNLTVYEESHRRENGRHVSSR